MATGVQRERMLAKQLTACVADSGEWGVDAVEGLDSGLGGEGKQRPLFSSKINKSLPNPPLRQPPFPKN